MNNARHWNNTKYFTSRPFTWQPSCTFYGPIFSADSLLLLIRSHKICPILFWHFDWQMMNPSNEQNLVLTFSKVCMEEKNHLILRCLFRKHYLKFICIKWQAFTSSALLFREILFIPSEHYTFSNNYVYLWKVPLPLFSQKIGTKNIMFCWTVMMYEDSQTLPRYIGSLAFRGNMTPPQQIMANIHTKQSRDKMKQHHARSLISQYDALYALSFSFWETRLEPNVVRNVMEQKRIESLTTPIVSSLLWLWTRTDEDFTGGKEERVQERKREKAVRAREERTGRKTEERPRKLFATCLFLGSGT